MEDMTSFDRVKRELENREDLVQFAIIQVGEYEEANKRVARRVEMSEKIGVIPHHYWFSENMKPLELIEEILLLEPHYDLVEVIFPLPSFYNSKLIEIFEAVNKNFNLQLKKNVNEFVELVKDEIEISAFEKLICKRKEEKENA